MGERSDILQQPDTKWRSKGAAKTAEKEARTGTTEYPTDRDSYTEHGNAKSDSRTPIRPTLPYSFELRGAYFARRVIGQRNMKG